MEFEVVIRAVTAPLEGQQLGEASDCRREMKAGIRSVRIGDKSIADCKR